jgi:hypothetical protein
MVRPTAGPEARSEHVSVRMSPSEKATLDRVRGKSSASDYLRRLLLVAARNEARS